MEKNRSFLPLSVLSSVHYIFFPLLSFLLSPCPSLLPVGSASRVPRQAAAGMHPKPEAEQMPVRINPCASVLSLELKARLKPLVPHSYL